MKGESPERITHFLVLVPSWHMLNPCTLSYMKLNTHWLSVVQHLAGVNIIANHQL